MNITQIKAIKLNITEAHVDKMMELVKTIVPVESYKAFEKVVKECRKDKEEPFVTFLAVCGCLLDGIYYGNYPGVCLDKQ